MPVVMHRSFPDGFELKTATIIKKPDGWYIAVLLEDDSVPTPKPIDEINSAIGVDLGLKSFLVTSEGESVDVQRYYRKTQRHLARQQKRSAKKEPGSANAQKQKEKISRIHQRIGRKREIFHYNVAHQLVQKYDLIVVEDLNIKGLAKTRLAKSIYDSEALASLRASVAWGKFLTIRESSWGEWLGSGTYRVGLGRAAISCDR